MKLRDKNVLFLALAVLVGTVAIWLYATDFAIWDKSQEAIPSVFADTKSVTYIRVLDGNDFDLKLEDGTRVRGHLRVSTVPEAKDKVIRFINNSKNPRVVLYRYNPEEKFWEIDLLLEAQQSSVLGDTSLTAWLRQEKLVWEKNLQQ